MTPGDCRYTRHPSPEHRHQEAEEEEEEEVLSAGGPEADWLETCGAGYLYGPGVAQCCPAQVEVSRVTRGPGRSWRSSRHSPPPAEGQPGGGGADRS